LKKRAQNAWLQQFEHPHERGEKSDWRQGFRKSTPKIIAVGLIIFLVGVVMSVFVFPPSPKGPDPRAGLIMLSGLVVFVLGLFMFVWVNIIGRYSES
jgi:hypothetical protein